MPADNPLMPQNTREPERNIDVDVESVDPGLELTSSTSPRPTDWQHRFEAPESISSRL